MADQRRGARSRIAPLVLAWACVAGLCGTARAGDAWKRIATDVPLSAYRFKYANYVCFWADGGRKATIKLINDYRDGHDWKTDVFFQVFDRDGTIARTSVPAGQTETVTLEPKTGRFCVVFMTSRRTHHRVDVGDRPWAFLGYATKASIDVESPRPQERLYFHVPADAKQILMRAYPLPNGSHSYMVLPDGRIGLDFVKQPKGMTTPTQLWKPLPAEARGRTCSWVLPPRMRRLALMPNRDGPYLLSPNPAHIAFLVERLRGLTPLGPQGESGAADVPPEALAPYSPPHDARDRPAWARSCR